jgi:hypothetical protein
VLTRIDDPRVDFRTSTDLKLATRRTGLFSMTLNVDALARLQAEILKTRDFAAETPDSRLRNALLLLAEAAEQKGRQLDKEN